MRRYQYISILVTIVAGLLVYLCIKGMMSWWLLLVLVIDYLIFMYFAVTQIQWNYFVQSYNKGDRNSKNIALTFDDGPNTETAAILDILKAESVKAAFFCIGKHIDEQPVLAMRMHQEGHVISNHSYRHTHDFDWMTTAKMVAEIEACNAAILKVAHNKPMLFRPPYGITNPNLDRAISRSGMFSIGWSLRSFDTMAKDALALKNRIINNLQGGDIILLHDSVPVTREILTDLISEARKKGFTFVRIDELLDIQAYA